MLPALPSAWPEGSVSGLRARGDVTVDVRWSGGTADEIGLRSGRSGRIAVRSDLFAGPFRLVDARTRRAVKHKRDGDLVTFRAERNRRYVATAKVNVAIDAPDAVEPGAEVPVDVTVSAAGELALDLPDGWSARPAGVSVQPGTYRFIMTAGSDDDGWAPVRAVLTGDGWRAEAVRRVQVTIPPPCPVPAAEEPLVAWDPVSGDVIDDASSYGRDATVQGGATYAGSALALGGSQFLRTAPTSLGFLPEATFAAEVKVTTAGSYRRLFDFQPVGDPGTDGVLVDLTPSNQVRFIGSGAGVTTSATVPTGRFVDLVVTMADDGEIAVYRRRAASGRRVRPGRRHRRLRHARAALRRQPERHRAAHRRGRPDRHLRPGSARGRRGPLAEPGVRLAVRRGRALARARARRPRGPRRAARC